MENFVNNNSNCFANLYKYELLRFFRIKVTKTYLLLSQLVYRFIIVERSSGR